MSSTEQNSSGPNRAGSLKLIFKMGNKIASLFIFIIALCTQSSFGSEALGLLKQKNHFAVLRHARAPGTGDPPNFKLGDCSTQRNLSKDGVRQAKELGAKLRTEFGNDFSVFTSQWCRCKDTAKLLGGRTPVELPLLNSFYEEPGSGDRQTKELRVWLTKNLPKYSPLILVTHQVNITALTGIFPPEGEIIILKKDKDGSITRVSPNKSY